MTYGLLRQQASWAARGLRPMATIATSLDDVLDTAPGSLRLLFGTDDYVAGAALMGQSRRAVTRDEARALNRADVVAAITPALARRWESIADREVHVIPNGVDVDHYAGVDAVRGTAADLGLSPPVAGFIGHLNGRIDIALLEAIAAGGISLLLVGPRHASFAPGRFERLIADPRVRWVGSQPYGALPDYLHLMDVGITPYVNDTFNRASFPLKTLEYLAAGRPVVATPLPATLDLDTSLIHVAGDPASFVAACRQAARDSRQPRLRALRREFAAANSWQARSDDILALIATGRDREASRRRVPR